MEYKKKDVFQTLGSSVSGGVEFLLAKVEKSVGRINEGGLGIEQEFSLRDVKFVMSFK